MAYRMWLIIYFEGSCTLHVKQLKEVNEWNCFNLTQRERHLIKRQEKKAMRWYENESSKALIYGEGSRTEP